MNRVLGRCLAGLAVATGALSLSAGCAHDDSSFFVQAVIFPQPQGLGTQCTYAANPSQIFLSRGVLDVGFGRQEYDAVFLLANQLVAQSNPSQAQTETSDINVQGAIVRVTDAAGNQLANYTTLTSGTVYAAIGGTPGYAVVSATAVSQQALAAAGSVQNGSKTLVSYLKFFGHTLGGDYIESNEFEFPVDVCNGCLVQFSSTDISCNFKAPNCYFAQVGTGMTNLGAQTLPCVFGQDTMIDCSQCLGYAICSPPLEPNPNGQCTIDAGGG